MRRTQTDWNKDVPWLGAWIPISVALVAFGALLRWIGVPMAVLGIVGPLAIAGLFWFLWGPNGRLGQLGRHESTEDEGQPDNPA